jgi:hypothetical protein
MYWQAGSAAAGDAAARADFAHLFPAWYEDEFCRPAATDPLHHRARATYVFTINEQGQAIAHAHHQLTNTKLTCQACPDVVVTPRN